MIKLKVLVSLVHIAKRKRIFEFHDLEAKLWLNYSQNHPVLLSKINKHTGMLIRHTKVNKSAEMFES